MNNEKFKIELLELSFSLNEIDKILNDENYKLQLTYTIQARRNIIAKVKQGCVDESIFWLNYLLNFSKKSSGK